MKLSSWPEIGSDGDVLLTPYVPKGITGYDDDDDGSFLAILLDLLAVDQLEFKLLIVQSIVMKCIDFVISSVNNPNK